ncbi:MAG: hypothetical protein ACFFDY_00175 [Candidatus Thorarchaeota archaeon]
MDNDLFETIKKHLPKNYSQFSWPQQREVLKRVKKRVLEQRKEVFTQPAQPPPNQNLIPKPSVRKEPKILTTGIDPKSKFVMVSFFTIDTPYEKEVKNLIKSLETLKLDYYIEGIEDLGGWVMNTQYKPVLIERVLKMSGKPVVCVDADAIVKKQPKLFEKMKDIDFAAYFPNSMRDRDKELFPGVNFIMDRLLSGTIYFNYTDGAFRLLEMWKMKCLEDNRTIDQNLLLDCVKSLKDKIMIRPLPLSYCQIYDIVRNKDNAVIEHFQASRRHRNTIRSDDSRKKKIAILTPSKKRPEGIKRLVESALEKSSFPSRIYFFFLIPRSDKISESMLQTLKKELTENIFWDYEPRKRRGEDINYSKFWNMLYDKSLEYNPYCFGFFGDDCSFETYSWDSIIVEEFKKNQNKPFFIRTNESRHNFRKLSTLFFTNKILHDILGRYLDTDYKQTWMDSDLHEICTKAGCFEFFKHIITYHHSIVLKRAKPDENYLEKLPDRHRIINADHELFHSEKKKKEREENILKIKRYLAGIR